MEDPNKNFEQDTEDTDAHPQDDTSKDTDTMSKWTAHSLSL